MRKLHQNGFSATETFLIVVLVAIIGVTGYYVYHASKKTSDTYSSAAKVAQSSPAPASKKGATASSNEAKAPADAQSPAASICLAVGNSSVSLTLSAAKPTPSCMKVSSSQTLMVINNTGQSVTVSLGAKSVKVPVGVSQSINDKFGNYLSPGVHVVHFSGYGSASNPEIWLQ